MYVHTQILFQFQSKALILCWLLYPALVDDDDDDHFLHAQEKPLVPRVSPHELCIIFCPMLGQFFILLSEFLDVDFNFVGEHHCAFCPAGLCLVFEKHEAKLNQVSEI